MIEIKFVLSGSFVGPSYHMYVNGKGYSSGFKGEEESKEIFLKILKDEYDCDMLDSEIEFEWDGTM